MWTLFVIVGHVIQQKGICFPWKMNSCRIVYIEMNTVLDFFKETQSKKMHYFFIQSTLVSRTGTVVWLSPFTGLPSIISTSPNCKSLLAFCTLFFDTLDCCSFSFFFLSNSSNFLWASISSAFKIPTSMSRTAVSAAEGEPLPQWSRMTACFLVNLKWEELSWWKNQQKVIKKQGSLFWDILIFAYLSALEYWKTNKVVFITFCEQFHSSSNTAPGR